MMLLHILSSTSFSQVPHGGVIRFFHKLVKRSTIPQVKLEKNAHSDLRGIVDALGVLEDNRLKKDHPLSVPLPSTYPVKFYRQYSYKFIPKFPANCVIAVVWNTKTNFRRACHLLSSTIPPSKWSPGFCCTQSW